MNQTELRELDAWIAEHVMGWHKVNNLFFPPNCDTVKKQMVWKYGISVPTYTTDPAAAMEVLKKCLQHEKMQCGFAIAYSKGFPHPFVVDDCIDDSFEICICRFAKKLFTKE